jgi:organic radical activating enzyme
MPHEMTRQSPPGPPNARFGAGVTIAGPAGEAPSATGPRPAVPEQPFHHLDELWIQVAGTVCNLTCTHCFVTCGPAETRHAMMSRAEVAARVAEGLALGVREIYFTGGEPFLNPGLESIVDDTLAHAPVTILTNGTLFTTSRVAWLAARSRASRYALELRVSLDGLDAASHDAFRGEGAWARTMRGLVALTGAGLLPIVTVTQPAHTDARTFASRAMAVLRAEGVTHPRLKLLPMFELGRERTRRAAGREALVLPSEPGTLAALPVEAFDPHRLQCGHARAVTSQGVFVCPLLVDEPGGRMAGTLADALRSYPLAHRACATCWLTGMTCANGQ